MEPTLDTSVTQKKEQQQQQQQQQQKQKQKQTQPHTTKRQPLTTNERIEREEAKELAKQQAIINKNNKLLRKQYNKDNQNKKKNSGTTKKRKTKDLPPIEATEILPYLFLGSALNAEDAALARTLRLSCVLNVAEELHAQVSASTQDATTQHAQDAPTQYTQDAITQDAITQKDAATQEITTAMEEISITQEITTTQDNTQCERISLVVHDEVPDGKDQYAIFEQAFLLIDKAKECERPVLVHCMRGRSRSASIVIGYLMTRNNMTLQQSYDYVKKLRPFIGPHRRLRRQLIKYEEHVTGKSSIDPQAQFWGV